MAGSHRTGQDMESGRVNYAEDSTILWAEQRPGSFFDGSAILIAEIAGSASDPEEYEEGDSFLPEDPIDGIIGNGYSGGSLIRFGGTPGAGVGVIGNGGHNEGTGVRGKGGGALHPGGIGVHGIGGTHNEHTAQIDPMVRPGTGVVAQGGRHILNENRDRLPHGAGVIAVAGGADRPFPPPADTGGVGAWAEGADAEMTMVVPHDAAGNSTSGPMVPSGPLTPGAGVFGRGGKTVPPRGPVAAGVIGLAGSIATIPGIAETGNTGVYGTGPMGVFGHGDTGVLGQGEIGPGLYGAGMTGDSRGGIFESARAAQAQLMPHPTGADFPNPSPVTPTAISANPERGPFLPKDGRGGDLLTLMDNQGRCGLWFCVKSADGGPAQWAAVLLGPSFAGIA
jgi:hypothetical protein